jgi:hypothetical protein
MKVTDKISGRVMTVFGIYWDRGKICFYCVPAKTTGLSVYGQDEVEVADPELGPDFRYVICSDGLPALFHHVLTQGDTLEGLLEHDPAVFEEFRKLVADALAQ